MLTIIVVTGVQFGIIRYDAVKTGTKPAVADPAGMVAVRIGFDKTVASKDQTLAEKWVLTNDTGGKVLTATVEAVDK